MEPLESEAGPANDKELSEREESNEDSAGGRHIRKQDVKKHESKKEREE